MLTERMPMPRVGMRTICILPLSSMMRRTPSCLPPCSVVNSTDQGVSQSGVTSALVSFASAPLMPFAVLMIGRLSGCAWLMAAILRSKAVERMQRSMFGPRKGLVTMGRIVAEVGGGCKRILSRNRLAFAAAAALKCTYPNASRSSLMDMREFLKNRSQFAAADLGKYAGLYIAWSPDGTKII